MYEGVRRGGCGGAESEILQMGGVLISFKALGEKFLFPLDCFLLISSYVAKKPHQSAEEVREVGGKKGGGGCYRNSAHVRSTL